ncbi:MULTISPECIES: hypothetical protein [unclassified Streptomyces]|uniref:hypothetical protein n=1 Tax=unclassified Streptomyces TaxID=2593676 RepID=UPI00036E90FD|nr:MULTISPECIES: hypothetical protein [unclassified Streptomyces]MYT32719.1 hypothetical protein [Streptomyces sp. SID8354]
MPPGSPEIDDGIRGEFRDEIDDESEAEIDAENGGEIGAENGGWSGAGIGTGTALRKSCAGVFGPAARRPRRGRTGPGGGRVIAQGAGRVRDREDGSVT